MMEELWIKIQTEDIAFEREIEQKTRSGKVTFRHTLTQQAHPKRRLLVVKVYKL